ncbi:hypothetical protein ACOPJQ_08380 [Luteimonas dalianensis]|uniref:hypothetical protein n=1 Tax=Luteimonas dalianensis TaxID=1148196 RepID=UPI003BF45BAD
MLATLLSCQACTGVDATEDPDVAPDSTSAVAFTVSGALEAEHRGVAWVRQVEHSRGQLFVIQVADSHVESEQTYSLRLTAMSEAGGVPTPGEYPIVSETDASRGYAGGFTAHFMDIMENRGGRYANVALEYDMPEEWKGHGLEGKLVIDHVDASQVTGRFELELMEGASINKAPRRDDKILRVREGRFTAVIPES